MDLLIKNIELPLEERIQLSIYPNGLVVNHSTLKIEKNRTTALELPEHGRLISDTDVKALLRSGLSLDSDSDMDYVCGLIDGLPTIVEASNGTDN